MYCNKKTGQQSQKPNEKYWRGCWFYIIRGQEAQESQPIFSKVAGRTKSQTKINWLRDWFPYKKNRIIKNPSWWAGGQED